MMCYKIDNIYSFCATFLKSQNESEYGNLLYLSIPTTCTHKRKPKKYIQEARI